MSQLFHKYLYEPILAILVFIYQNIAFGDLGLAIIILTIFIRVVLFPLFYKSAKDQAIMRELQPKIKKIQQDHKEDKEAQTKALITLYKDHRFNPFSGIFLVILQLPILIGLYQVFLKGLDSAVFVNHTFFGLIDLGEKSIFVALIAAALQYFQGKLTIPKKLASSKDDPTASFGKTMLYVGPFVTLIILINLPAALGFYWATSTLISVLQQVYINRKLASSKNGENSREDK